MSRIYHVLLLARSCRKRESVDADHFSSATVMTRRNLHLKTERLGCRVSGLRSWLVKSDSCAERIYSAPPWRHAASHVHTEAVIFFVAAFFRSGSVSPAVGDVLIEIDDAPLGPHHPTLAPDGSLSLHDYASTRGDSHIPIQITLLMDVSYSEN